jgi:ABC-type dipeptide/oligopeptide/nickel transport system ATPase component
MSLKLSVDALYRRCDPGLFSFNTTDDIKEQEGLIGQERALRAIDFGLSLPNKGFNIFALGESGTGKARAIRSILTERAAQEPVPTDWCYVYNFKDPDAPVAVSLKPGLATIFQKEMSDLVKTLTIEIPKAFESREYEQQRNSIMDEFQQKQREHMQGIEEDAAAKGFTLKRGTPGLFIIPVKKTGEPLSEEEFAALDQETKTSAEKIGKML